MDIEVLGPLRVRVSGVDVAPSAPKPRVLLALLACQLGEAVSTAAIVEELWGGDVPRSASTTVQTYVMQLRTHIGAALLAAGASPEAARSVLVTRGRGYELTGEGGTSDLSSFETAAERGHRAVEAGDWRTARQSLGAALALWRGAALADVPTGPWLSALVTRLEEARLSLLVQAIGVELQLGNHYLLLGELAALTDRHPLHEALHQMYMVALYRTGHPDRALRVYGRLRAALDESLGLDPLGSVERLRGALLVASPALEPAPVPVG